MVIHTYKDLQFVSCITGYSLCSLHNLLHPTVLTLLESERGTCGLEYWLPVSIISSYPLALPLILHYAQFTTINTVLIISMITSILFLVLSYPILLSL